MRNSESLTPFQLGAKRVLDTKILKIMYDTDETIASERCILNHNSDEDSDDDDSDDSDDDDDINQMLPLELLCHYNSFDWEHSDVIPCFNFLKRICQANIDFERLYKNAEGDHDFVLRLLLNADGKIEPEKRRDLNFKARKGGMFLAFRALSNDLEPNIWIKLRHESIDLLMHTISYL
jgi:hypothetical protein